MARSNGFARRMGKVALALAVLGATIAVAYVLGAKAAELVQNKRARERRAANSLAALHDMKPGIALGNSLPDGVLENLEGDEVYLHDLVSNSSVISFIRHDCPYCQAQLRSVKKIAKTAEEEGRFILISLSDPTDLWAMRDEFKIQSPILYDRDTHYNANVGVAAVPFNFIVDRDLRIQQVVSGPMTEDEIAGIINANK